MKETKLFERTINLIGLPAFERLRKAKILIAGIGGVGSYVAEALARSGIGELVLIDKDVVEITNLNRQLHATLNTLNRPKVEAMADRLSLINPYLKIGLFQDEIMPGYLENTFQSQHFTYVADCVDDIKAKLELILYAKHTNTPIVSSMGTANRLDNTHFKIDDISKTKMCPLARKMRKKLKEHNILKGVKVLYAETTLCKNDGILGTMSYVPGTAGLLIAGEIIQSIIYNDVCN